MSFLGVFSPAAPEIALLAATCLVLLVDLYGPGEQRRATYLFSQLALMITALAVVFAPDSVTGPLAGHYVTDGLAMVLKLAALFCTSLVFVYARQYLSARGLLNGEFFLLSLFAVLGIQVLASAGSLLTLYLGLETLALSLYALVALHRDNLGASEAAMKYFFLGALASGIMLYGMSLLYGVAGALDLGTIANVMAQLVQGDGTLLAAVGVVFVVAAVAFKLGAAPFHMWLPDVYEGAATPVTMFLATTTKLGAFALLARLLIDGLNPLLADWQPLLIVLAVFSLAVGNIVAIAQTNIKRMLGYSTVSHMGFMLLGILSGSPGGYSAGLFYMLVYALTGLLAFGVVILLTRAGFEADQIADYRGLNQRSAWHAFVMMLAMLSLAGVPPLVGFYAKLAVIQAILAQGLVWLAVLAVVFSVIGAFYYLRVIKLMYFDRPEEHARIEMPGDYRLVLAGNGVALLALGFFPAALYELCLGVF